MTTRTFSLDALAAAAAEVIGVSAIRLTPTMTATEVPGWDSLAHTLIVLEVGNALGVELRADEIAALPNFGAMVEYVNAHLAAT